MRLGLIESWSATYSDDGEELIVEASNFEETVILRFADVPIPSP